MPGAPLSLISIVTPSYKQLDWLKLCAASIADQEGVTVEHIIQDAESGPELENWVRKNTSAQIHVEKDANMYDGVNRGLRRTTGDLCAYLNCDEQYLPGTLRRVVDYFAQHPEADVLFGDSIIVDASLLPLAYRRASPPSEWHTQLCPMNILTCSTFFRRKLIDEGALFDTGWKNLGDKSWIIGLLRRGYGMAVLPEPMSVFTLTGANLSQQQNVHAERQRWREGVPPMIRWAKPVVRAVNVVNKWRHGAYQNQRIDSAWYTRESYPKRRTFEGVNLSWKWPTIPPTGTA